jgi:ABC-type antimicrobial peptide transport system permease subunit
MFLTYIYRELRRRHRQALLTALGLAVGVGLVVVVTAYARGVSEAQDTVLQSLYGVGTDITVTRTAQAGSGGPAEIGMNPGERQDQGERFSRDRVMTSPGQQAIATTKIDQIAALDGVSSVAGGLAVSVMHVEGKFAEMTPAQGGQQSQGQQSAEQPQTMPSQAPIQIASYTITGVDVTDQTIGPLSSATVTKGRTFTSAETDAKVMLVEKGYAKQNELTVGDTKKIDGAKYEIVGLVTSSSSSADFYLPLARAQTIADEDGVSQIYVKADSAENIAAVKTSIKTVFPKATVTTAEDLADQVSGSLASASKLADQLGAWLAVAALIAAFLVASLLTVSSVSRRVREFGTLKALGWRSRRIVGQVLGESFVQGVAGGLIGVVIGLAGAWAITALSPALEASVGSVAGVAVAGPGMGGGMPGGDGGQGGALAQAAAAANTVTVELGAPVSIQLVLIAVGLAVAGGLLAGAFGGWRAARLRPADALRRVD